MSALKPRKTKQINLLPKETFSETTVGRIVLWFLSTFRAMVIVVELIVVSAFLSRFWLDSKNADLKEEIEQKQAQIKAFESTEKSFREIQKKSLAFSTLASQPKMSPIISSITSLVPPAINLSSITFSDKTVAITGDAPDEKEIAQLLVNLKTDQNFDEISLQQLSPSQEEKGLLKFVINLRSKIETSSQNNQ